MPYWGFFVFCILMVYTDVGPNADVGRWCKEESVHCSIDSINHIIVYKHINPKTHVLDVVINKETNAIYIQGWVASTERIKIIRISLGGINYPVNYGNKREDVAAHFNNPDYLYSGFNANIPISDFSSGYHKLSLKVYIEGIFLSIHSPSMSKYMD